jgi:hypothetical protein
LRIREDLLRVEAVASCRDDFAVSHPRDFSVSAFVAPQLEQVDDLSRKAALLGDHDLDPRVDSREELAQHLDRRRQRAGRERP